MVKRSLIQERNTYGTQSTYGERSRCRSRHGIVHKTNTLKSAVAACDDKNRLC